MAFFSKVIEPNVLSLKHADCVTLWTWKLLSHGG